MLIPVSVQLPSPKDLERNTLFSLLIFPLWTPLTQSIGTASQMASIPPFLEVFIMPAVRDSSFGTIRPQMIRWSAVPVLWFGLQIHPHSGARGPFVLSIVTVILVGVWCAHRCHFSNFPCTSHSAEEDMKSWRFSVHFEPCNHGMGRAGIVEGGRAARGCWARPGTFFQSCDHEPSVEHALEMPVGCRGGGWL